MPRYKVVLEFDLEEDTLDPPHLWAWDKLLGPECTSIECEMYVMNEWQQVGDRKFYAEGRV